MKSDSSTPSNKSKAATVMAELKNVNTAIKAYGECMEHGEGTLTNGKFVSFQAKIWELEQRRKYLGELYKSLLTECVPKK